MTLKKLGNLGLLALAFTFGSCADQPKSEENTELEELASLEDQAFQEAVSVQEIKIENYIKLIDEQLIDAENDIREELTEKKEIAQSMLLRLRSDFVELNDETAAKWDRFQENIEQLINVSVDDINYAQEMESPNLDS